MSLNEFDIIDRYFSTIGLTEHANSAVKQGVGDDCALLKVPDNSLLAQSSDTFIADVHFPMDAPAAAVAERCLAAAVSDLAAMGARPLSFSLALTLPAADQLWLQAFSEGLRRSADYYCIPLVGGDTTKGALSITIHAQGTLPANGALMRSGAQVGDDVVVSGTLGDAAIALAILNGNVSANTVDQQYLLTRFYQPEARIKLGQKLLTIADAAIDISDGLLADLTHITQASGVAAEIIVDKLPLSQHATAVLGREQARDYALSGGDDYELCFTINPSQRWRLKQLADQLALPLTVIGRIISGEGVRCVDSQHQPIVVETLGYRHFE
jgi:thiamine-monophosphate kinase